MTEGLMERVDTQYRILISTNPHFEESLEIGSPHTVQIKNGSEGAEMYASQIIPGQLVRPSKVEFPLYVNGEEHCAGEGIRIMGTRKAFAGEALPYVEGPGLPDGEKIHFDLNEPYEIQTGKLTLWVKYQTIVPE